MRKLILLLLIFTSSTLMSCGKSNNESFDLTNLKIPIQKNNKFSSTETTSSIPKEQEIITNKLIPYPTSSQILDSSKIGKIDPFSKGEVFTNNLNLQFKLNGFLKTESNNYVFVSYLDDEGTLTDDSIGGINTNLLPNGAKVLNIDPENMKLTIEFNNENFIFEL